MLPPLRVKPRRTDLKPGECLCDYCVAKCCRYFALPIDTPESHAEFDTVRWFLLHEQTSIFIEEGDWYLIVHTPCRHLQPNNLCGIYQSRPEICREYSTKNCEYEDDWTYDQYFETPEQLAEYAEAVLAPKKDRGIRSARPGLPVLRTALAAGPS